MLDVATVSHDDVLVRVKRDRSNCGKIWLDGDLLLGAGATLLVFLAFFLNQLITMIGRRRRRKRDASNASQKSAIAAAADAVMLGIAASRA